MLYFTYNTFQHGMVHCVLKINRQGPVNVTSGYRLRRNVIQSALVFMSITSFRCRSTFDLNFRTLEEQSFCPDCAIVKSRYLSRSLHILYGAICYPTAYLCILISLLNAYLKQCLIANITKTQFKDL